jgi:hypothetical protein
VTARKGQVYVQCGLRLRSQMELHLPTATGDGWDVDVRWGPDLGEDSTKPPPGEVIVADEFGGTTWYTATSTGSGYLMRFPNCGELTISADLSEVQVRRDPSGRAELLPILLVGAGMSLLLALRGRTVLHASAVAIDGSAVAFVGQSGRGKSTVAALLCVEGAELVTDDVLTVDPGPPPTCLGGAAELRLRPGVADLVVAAPADRRRVTVDERLAFAPKRAPLGPLPLAAIVIPAPSRDAGEVESRPLAPSDALVALLSFPRVHGWRDPAVLSRDFSTLTNVVNAVPVLDVTIPWGPPFRPDVAGALSTVVRGAIRSGTR